MKQPRNTTPRGGTRWTAQEDALLGTMPDELLAARLGRPLSGVLTRRHDLNLPTFAPKVRLWTPEEDALLGTDLDKAIAIRLGVRRAVVGARRDHLGIPPFGRNFWTPAELSQLGSAPDKVIAERLGRSVQSVKLQRLRRKIRRCQPT